MIKSLYLKGRKAFFYIAVFTVAWVFFTWSLVNFGQLTQLKQVFKANFTLWFGFRCFVMFAVFFFWPHLASQRLNKQIVTDKQRQRIIRVRWLFVSIFLVFESLSFLG